MTPHHATIAISAVLLAFGLSTAVAQEFQESPSVTVVYGHPDATARTELVLYGDLNLAAEAGRRVFIGRVERAVDRVCGGPTNDLIDLIESRGFRTCRDEAMADARPKMDAVMGAALRYPSVAAIGGFTGR
jgi:UrcA family protein